MATLRNQDAAEEAAQKALLHVLNKGTDGIANLESYVCSCAHNTAVDQVTKGAGRFEVLSAPDSWGQRTNGRRGHNQAPGKLLMDSETARPLGWRHRQPLSPEHVLALLRDVFCVLCSTPDAAVSLFTRTVLLTCFAPTQRAEAMAVLKRALASPQVSAPMALAERRVSALPWLGILPPEELSDYVDDLFAAMQYILSDLSFLRAHTELLAVAVRSAAVVVRGMQNILKGARLDIIMRSKSERHSLYDSRLTEFMSCIDALYVAANIPRSYTVAGITYYLHEITNARVHYHNLLDAGYVESYLAKFALSHNNGHYIDRWVAIIGLAMLYEISPGASQRRQHLLSEVEGKARLSSLERVGTAFAWLNSEQSNQKDVIDRKVLQLINMQEASELSVLPITLHAPTLFRPADNDLRAEHQKLLWEVIHRALSAKSHIAKIGALRHLFYETRPALRHAPDDVRSVVLALQNGENRVLAGMARQLKFT